MPTVASSPGLADAADVLSDQLREHLTRLAELIEPHAETLERRFMRLLRNRKLDAKQRSALAAITPGAAARILSDGAAPSRFFEQVEYNGRRLAKLNLPPNAIVGALEDYDRLLTPLLRGLIPEEHANLKWVREQLHFCVILTLNNAYYQVRESETQAFYELFRVELESSTFEELVQRFLETLVSFCRADEGRLFLVDDITQAWVARASVGGRESLSISNSPSMRKGLARPRYIAGESIKDGLVLDPAWRRKFASCWSVPLATRGRIAGVIQFGFTRSYEWLPREQELLSAAAERCLLSAEKARLMEDLAAREEQVRQLAEHMLHVEEVERRRISRELHDEAGQSLLCIRLQMEMMERAVLPEQDELRSKLKELLGQTDHTILEIRRLIAALSPAVLESLGLGAALRQLVKRFRRLHPCRVRLQLTRLGGLPKKTETIVYRLLQECCNNIAKHSRASTVNISVVSADGRLKLNVEDNGVGFDVNEAISRRDSFGLSGIRERVAVLGGRCEVTSRHQGNGDGTKNGIGQHARDTVRTRSVGVHTTEVGHRAPVRQNGRSGTRIFIELPIPSEA